MAFRRVVDARGVDRRVYNLRARWRSLRLQREFPEPLYEAICRTAAGDFSGVDQWPQEMASRRGALPSAQGWATALLAGALTLMVVKLTFQLVRGAAPNSSDISPLILVSCLLFTSLLHRKLEPLHRRVPFSVAPSLSRVDDGQMAAAVVVNGRCPSCAYPLDPEKPEADGAVVCAECGGAWLVVKRGGLLRLGR